MTNATLNGQKATFIKRGRGVQEAVEEAGSDQNDEGPAQKKARK
jgi:hypothetical protein